MIIKDWKRERYAQSIPKMVLPLAVLPWRQDIHRRPL
jgi:hypothetical protein